MGYFVGSCRSCDSCGKGNENYCAGVVLTSNGVDHAHGGVPTKGGFSDVIVVNEHYVVRVPDGLALDRTAPLLCAGVTVYSPMMRHGLNEAGKHLGVVGLGGLGHVAVKFGKAFGMKVTVISTSPGKKQEAIDRLGADGFVVSKDAEEMKAAASSMDAIINTVSANVPLAPFMGLLKPNGKMIMVGLPTKALEIPPFDLIMGNKTLAGSCIGGMRDTQEMLDVAAKHGVTADIELVPADYVNTAMERLAKADVRYRFVIDIGNTLKNSE